MTTDANAFLLGTGGRSAKFPQVGAQVWGPILDFQLTDQTEFGSGKVLTWDDGQPKKQVVVTLQTKDRESDEDDGVRKVYVKGQMQRAVADAIRATGAEGMERGGMLLIRYTGDGEAKRGYSAPKLYMAKYERPTMPMPGADMPDDDSLPF